MYRVNKVIITDDPTKPIIRVLGMMSNKAIINSVVGSIQEIKEAKSAIKGDFPKLYLKVLASNSLLKAVYTNSKISSAEMISTIVARFIDNKVGSWLLAN